MSISKLIVLLNFDKIAARVLRVSSVYEEINFIQAALRIV